MIYKVLGVGVVTIIINLILRHYKPEFAVLANICGGLIIFSLLMGSANDIISSFVDIQSSSKLNINIISPLLKVVTIGYITEFTADLAEDSGNKSIADKIIVGGKIAICLLALPIIKTLLSAILSLIN